jgi:chromosomal replication initiation ATPase DnaA
MAHRPAQQLPLDLGFQPAHSRDDLLVGDENEAALHLIDSWPHWQVPVAVLVGPVGAGKTHLLEIFREEREALDAGTRFENAMEGAAAGLPIVLDDADRGLRSETELFHLINAVRSGGASLLMTARERPANWPVALPDLRSRLSAATLVELAEPGDALLSAVVMKLFADRQVSIEPHVVQFITRRIERSVGTAITVVDRLDKAAWEQHRPITRALAAEILGSGAPFSSTS